MGFWKKHFGKQGGSGGSAVWGGITGNIDDQTDLKDEITAAKLATQTWLAAVQTKANLSAVPNQLQNYLCRVIADANAANNGVWQWIGGASTTDWTYFSDNLDFIDEIELDVALANKADTSDLAAHICNTNNPHNVTKSQIGLANVDNTSDSNKPISTATQTALNAKAEQSNTYTKYESDYRMSETLYPYRKAVIQDEIDAQKVDKSEVGNIVAESMIGGLWNPGNVGDWTGNGYYKLALLAQIDISATWGYGFKFNAIAENQKQTWNGQVLANPSHAVYEYAKLYFDAISTTSARRIKSANSQQYTPFILVEARNGDRLLLLICAYKEKNGQDDNQNIFIVNNVAAWYSQNAAQSIQYQYFFNPTVVYKLSNAQKTSLGLNPSIVIDYPGATDLDAYLTSLGFTRTAIVRLESYQ